MPIDDTLRESSDSKFAFGENEIERAKNAQAVAKRVLEELRMKPRAALQATAESRGCDPYNSSGGFDRRRHWERVGRR